LARKLSRKHRSLRWDLNFEYEVEARQFVGVLLQVLVLDCDLGCGVSGRVIIAIKLRKG
jgi:hypothetical protein